MLAAYWLFKRQYTLQPKEAAGGRQRNKYVHSKLILMFYCSCALYKQITSDKAMNAIHVLQTDIKKNMYNSASEAAKDKNLCQNLMLVYLALLPSPLV